MRNDDYLSPAFVSVQHAYSSSQMSTASTSSASGWSDASSQYYDDISVPSSSISDCDSFSSGTALALQTSEGAFDSVKPSLPCLTQATRADVPSELRQNPRRTTTRTGCPPILLRQVIRKGSFVDNLVDSSTHIVEAIWPTSSVICRSQHGGTGVLPLRTFIQETLRRSRTSYSTLQVALYYLVLIKSRVPDRDFTMEQLDDSHASRAIQCGRRMFLAALILASKYLQDRNYSARAWSKISGLNVQEINENEMAFLLAVNWKLHITETVYNRWTDCVMKFTPSQPPSPGGADQRVYERQSEDFRAIVLKLTPDLSNLEDLTCWSPITFDGSLHGALYTPPNERNCPFSPEDVVSSLRSLSTPSTLEPNPTPVHTPGRFAPSLSLLTTPRLTPSTGFSTPAVSAASHLLAPARSSMGFALAHVSNGTGPQCLDRWPATLSSSPQSYITRRSSLANSMSTASSPESMVSDTSRTSRSSSISSASSLAIAPSSRADAQARCRYGKPSGERMSVMPTIVSAPEDYVENCMSSSPEMYVGTMGKDLYGHAMEPYVAHSEREMDEAARALQELHNYGRVAPVTAVPCRTGLKRSRPTSIDNSLQDNVRRLLADPTLHGESMKGSDTVDRRRTNWSAGQAERSRKRVCRSAEAEESRLAPGSTVRRAPGMWEGILN